jgi:hypothetical protein
MGRKASVTPRNIMASNDVEGDLVMFGKHRV